MARELIFVHGRSQEHKDSIALKAAWVDAFRSGLDKSGLDLPLTEAQIHFPYYGQTLYDLTEGTADEDIAEVVVRGDGGDELETEFVRSVIREIQKQYGVTDDRVQELAGDEVLERGLGNAKWVRKVFQALDRYIPGASAAFVALATRDVYKYLRNPGFQKVVDTGVAAAFSPGVEAVVVGHSLGSVVSYNVLRREGQSHGWTVPLYVTLGAPLAINAVKEALRPISHPKCASRWFNAMDSRDVVALHPLDATHFRIDPSIENKVDVDNPTGNRHGISGYLGDKDVAKLIYDALN